MLRTDVFLLQFAQRHSNQYDSRLLSARSFLRPFFGEDGGQGCGIPEG